MTNPDPTLPKIPKRDPKGHKGVFGTVCVYGGSAHGETCMVGAPALTAEAALRAGTGLARVAAPESIIEAVLTITPSATGILVPTQDDGGVAPHDAAGVIDACVIASDCLVIGPGMGVSDGSRAAVLRAVQQEDIPVVVDADAINCLADLESLHSDFHAAAILTPHPGEYRRLAAALKIDLDPTDESTRAAACEQLAQRLGSIVALKGAGTVVSDGHRTWTNKTGSAALATAGTGDVLAGVIAALVAQFVAPPMPAPMPRPAHKPLDLFDATRLAVCAHGLAAEIWSERNAASAGLLAEELAASIPEALERLREQ